MALWAERLVGDWPDRDDPPVIVALTQLDLAEITRLDCGRWPDQMDPGRRRTGQ